MKPLSGKLEEAYASWTYAISQCCASWANRSDEEPRHLGDEKTFEVIQDEPAHVPPPNMALFGARKERGSTEGERAPRKRRHGSGWSSFSARNRLLRNGSSSRRPLISGPYNFQHLYSESFRFPGEEQQQQQPPHLQQHQHHHHHHQQQQQQQQQQLQAGPLPDSFQPLELNIHDYNNKLSPILPHFDYPSPPVTPPPRAILHSSPSDDSYTISHQRSHSSMSFHIPRRPVPGGSVFESPHSDHSTTPQRPRPARVRAYTASDSPSTIMEDLVERVASAMLERDLLQEKIEDVIERQSIYTTSRPSTAYGQPEMEPMPDIPALPPDAPSFSERLSSDRPRTAPSKTPTPRAAYQANSSRKVEGRAPPPPLPLRLRPPLRKKKSFSRVSTWLFLPGGEHQHQSQQQKHGRDISLDSVTNLPMPVTDADGFYQVAPAPRRRASRPDSFDSVSSVSDWSASAAAEEAEAQTLPTSWSQSSYETSTKAFAPAAASAPPTHTTFDEARQRDAGPRPPPGRIVGVAF